MQVPLSSFMREECRCRSRHLRGEDASAASLLDLLLGESAEELGLDDHGQLGQMPFAEDFEEASFADVDDGSLARNRRPLIFRKQGYQLIQIDDGAVELVPLQMVRPHADFSEVTRMVLVEIDSVVMLATGVTATTGVFAVFSDATMTVTDVTSQLSRLLGLLFRHFLTFFFF